MSINKDKLRLYIYTFFALIAFIMVIDYVLPGKKINDEIITVNSERQQYYNAGGNYHYAYHLQTSEHVFPVSEAFATIAQNGDRVDYAVSGIFSEVNWYRLSLTEGKTIYPLRYLTGLVVPLLMLITLFVAYRTKWNMGTLIFVLQVLLIADLVFLIM